MSDLLLQDFENLSTDRLTLLLSDERREMFGAQKVSVKKRVVHRLPFSIFVGSFTRLRKAGERDARH